MNHLRLSSMRPIEFLADEVEAFIVHSRLKDQFTAFASLHLFSISVFYFFGQNVDAKRAIKEVE